MRFRFVTIAVLGSLLFASPARSQSPAYDLSTLFNGNFQLRTDDATRALTGGEPSSRFDVARVYVTLRAPVGDRANVRLTTDVYQNAADGYYGGLAIRLKYAILQYDLTRRLAGVDGLTASARVGMLQTVVIEHIETFWPRWIGPVALETNGFFSSADIGAALHSALPNGMGEAYVTMVNGSGYASPETDRFKDVAARLSLTPFAARGRWLRSFTISPWYYAGARASQFVAVNPAEVGPVSEGLQKDRRGIFVGLRERALTIGAEYAQRIEELEGGANTVVSPRTVSGRTSALQSAFAVIRPAELADSSRRSRLALYGRLDRFALDGNADARNDFTILGVSWDLARRLSVAVDYQGLTPTGGSTTAAARSWAFRWTVGF